MPRRRGWRVRWPRAGAAFSLVNPTTKAEKLGFILRNCRAAALVTEARLQEVAAAALAMAPDVACRIVAGAPGLPGKGGDGLADLKPIAHLYKTQVYALAEALDVPAEIHARPPTTDTWSLPQTQEEFYFALPWATMDLCLLALDRGVPAEDAARAAGLDVAAIQAAWRDIAAKRRVAAYLHAAPLLAAPEAA